MKQLSLTVFLVSSFLLISCTDVNQSEQVEIDPAISFQELETRLLNAESMHLQFQVTATGAAEISVTGQLQRVGGDQYSLTAAGEFTGTPVTLSLITQNGSVIINNEETESSFDMPPELTPSLLLGLTRMGILHNVSRMIGPLLPDHATGGVADWVQTIDHNWVLTEDTENSNPAIGFAIAVNGTETATATLEISAAGLPLRRSQVVNFAGVNEAMRVVEDYTFVSID